MDQEELKLTPYFHAVWRRRLLIVITTLGALLAGIGASMLDPRETESGVEYEAVAVVRIEDQTEGIDLGDSTASAAAALLGFDNIGSQGVQTHIQLIQSSGVLTRAVNRIREASDLPPGTDQSELDAAIRQLAASTSVSQVSRSELITVSATAGDADLALLRAESIVGGYFEYLRDQSIQATQDSIDEIDMRLDDSSLPRLTSTRLNIFMERLSVSELDRVDRAVATSISQINEVDLSGVSNVPPLEGLVSELESAEARFQTASIGLTNLENDLNRGTGSLSGVLGQQSVASVQELVFSALTSVQTIQSDYSATAIARDLDRGTSVLVDTNTLLSDSAFQIGTLSTNLSISASNRALLAQHRDQVLAVRGSNVGLASSLLSKLEDGTATENDRRRMLTQIGSAVSTLNVILTSIGEVRQSLTDPAPLTQLISVEGLLQGVVTDLRSASTTISTNATAGPVADLAQLENLLADVEERLELLVVRFDSPSAQLELLKAEVDGATSKLTSAAELTGRLRTNPNLRSAPSFVNLLLVEPQVNAGASLLRDVSTNLGSGVSLSSEILQARVTQARETADAGLERTREVKQLLQSADLSGETGSALQLLESASSDLADLAVSALSSSQVMSATASAGLSQSLSSRMSRYGTDLANASNLLTSSTSRLETITIALNDLPEVRINSALANLMVVQRDLEETRNIVQDILERSENGILTVADAGEVGARLALIEATLSTVTSSISQIPVVEITLTAQGLQSAQTRLEVISSQLSDIEAAETTALDDLYALRRELQLAVLGPQDIGVSLLETIVNDPVESGTGIPIDPRIFAAGFVGLLLGVVGAFALEMMDRTVRRPEDIGEIAGVPSLGMVPQGAAKGNPHPPEITDDPTSIFSEAVHLVATRVQGKVTERSRTLLIASPRPREGKTMMAINLAEALSLRSLKVLLIDANFRKPDASRIFEFENEPGLATALTQERDPEEFIKTVNEGRLHLLPAGRSMVPPVELISRPNMSTLLQRVRQQYDFVIIDGPPALGFAESNALAKLAGGIIMVARSGVTRKNSLREATENLADSEIFGVVMNFVSPKELGYLEHQDYVRHSGPGKWNPVRLVSNPRTWFSRN